MRELISDEAALRCCVCSGDRKIIHAFRLCSHVFAVGMSALDRRASACSLETRGLVFSHAKLIISGLRCCVAEGETEGVERNSEEWLRDWKSDREAPQRGQACCGCLDNFVAFELGIVSTIQTSEMGRYSVMAFVGVSRFIKYFQFNNLVLCNISHFPFIMTILWLYLCGFIVDDIKIIKHSN